jgi:hypothetical protein
LSSFAGIEPIFQLTIAQSKKQSWPKPKNEREKCLRTPVFVKHSLKRESFKQNLAFLD